MREMESAIYQGMTRQHERRRPMRRWIIVGLTGAALYLATPPPAFALFEWLDHLSGPGPFHGVELQFRLVCAMDQATHEEVVKATREVDEPLHPGLPRPSKADVPPAGTLRGFMVGQMGQSLPLLEIERTIHAFADLKVPAAQVTLPPDTDSASPGNLRVPNAVPNQVGTIKTLVDLGDDLQKLLALLEQVRPIAKAAQAPPQTQALDTAALRARDVAYSASIGRIRPKPGKVLWASCYDGPTRHQPRTDDRRVPDPDYGRPVFSLNANYRFYTTGQLYGVFGQGSSRDEYANRENISLQMYQLQASFPLSGRADIIDGQTSAGVYRFASNGFGTFYGMVFEPIRFDLHVPARLAYGKGWWFRALTSPSLRWGLVMFPGGIEASRFNPKGAAVGKDISGSEAIFDWGVVLNLSRITWKRSKLSKTN